MKVDFLIFFLIIIKELVEIVNEKPQNLIVSDDKFLLGTFGFRNRLIYSNEANFKKGKNNM